MAAALALARPRGIGLQKLSRNLIGARSIEAIQTTVGSNTTTAYPLYDLMGNMKATLAKSGSGFSTTNWRQWDAWGEVRSSDGTGGPSYGYVANLGHPGDAEGSLTYMRARYYEAATGRFVSEDPAGDGNNWYSYAGSAPTTYADHGGTYQDLVYTIGIGVGIMGVMLAIMAWGAGGFKTPLMRLQFITNALVASAVGFGAAFSGGTDARAELRLANIVLGGSVALLRAIIAMAVADSHLESTPLTVKIAHGATLAYNMAVVGALIAIDTGVM